MNCAVRWVKGVRAASRREMAKRETFVSAGDIMRGDIFAAADETLALISLLGGQLHARSTCSRCVSDNRVNCLSPCENDSHRPCDANSLSLNLYLSPDGAWAKGV